LFLSGWPRQPAHNGPCATDPFPSPLPCLVRHPTTPTYTTLLPAQDPHRLHAPLGTGPDPPPLLPPLSCAKTATTCPMFYPLCSIEKPQRAPFCFPPRPAGTSQDGSHRRLPRDPALPFVCLADGIHRQKRQIWSHCCRPFPPLIFFVPHYPLDITELQDLTDISVGCRTIVTAASAASRHPVDKPSPR
jgi:hypothetical protein